MDAIASRRPSRPLIAAAFFLVVASAEAQPAGTSTGEGTAIERFVGTYHAADLERNATIIASAIHEGTEAMGPVRRKVGRRRLHAVNEPVRVVRIVLEGDRLVTDFDGDRYAAPITGEEQRAQDPQGEPIRVSYRVSGDRLVARYVGPDGEKQITFDISDGARMTMTSVLLSDQLPAPIRYSLAYHRR